jgi:hypothetical protein
VGRVRWAWEDDVESSRARSMPEEMRCRRPGRGAGVDGRETAVVVAARVSMGREKLGVAVTASSVAAMVWACGRRGRWGVAVVPYIVAGGVARKRDVVESVGVAAVLGGSAALRREERS